MALFKIARGPSNALGTLPTKATEGFAYFQPYDGSFYIDITTANAAVIARSTEENASANRIKIAAGIADKVGHTLSINGKSFNGIQNIDVGTIGVGYGGTGETEWTQYGVIYASATDTLGQATAAAGGAILVTGNSKAPTWLAAGNAGDILKSNSTTGAPEWIDPTTSLTAYKTVKTLFFYAADASGADAPTGTTSISFNGSADKSISTKTINALNKAGGTMTGTIYFANGTVYYIDNAGCAKFNSLDTAGATNLGSTLGVTGATTLSSTLAVTGATTLSSTLAVTDTATMYHVIPADDNTTYELGSATARWKKLHIGTADTYGSATQPIWWSDGKPAECTSYANAVVKSAGEFTSEQSITLTGDVTGTASSKAGWSIAATAWKLTPHEHDATYVAATTTPTDYNGKLIFTGMKTNTTLGITSELTYSYVIGLRGYSSKSGGGSHEFAFNDNAIYHRMSSTGADTWGSWNMLVRSAAGGATGSATEPVWVNSAGVITACTSYANASVNYANSAGSVAWTNVTGKPTIDDGTAGRLVYYSATNTLSQTTNIHVLNNYLLSTSRNSTTVDVRANGLIIWGRTYGNTAAEMLSNTAGVFRFSDGGPQIVFNTSNSWNAQAGALIFTDNDTAGTGTSFHFVTTESSDDTGGNCTVTAPRFRARKSLTVGQNTDNTSYTLYINGTSCFTGAVTFANGIWNVMGDDCYIGDCNVAGCVGLKGKNGLTGISFQPYTSGKTVTGKLWLNDTASNGEICTDRDFWVTVDAARSIACGSYRKSGVAVACHINSSGTNHGIYSWGYSDGTTYTASGAWLIYRDSTGAITCNGNASTATRIKGNLASATSDVNRNIWVSSTTSADGIPNYISGFNMNPSTKVFTVPSGTRISPSAGALYLGNSGNQGWVYVQDMASQAEGTPWKLTQAGVLTCVTVNATLNGNATSATTATKATQDGSGNTITSYYVTLSTDQTNITGCKRFTKAVQCYRYTTDNNLPAITMDKPGSNYVGIGADGTNNRIKFGPCSSLDGAAWVAQSSFNSNQWFFQGSIYGTSTIQTESTATFNAGIVSNHGQNFMVGGNEFNCIPDGYNSTFWFNYETFNRKANGNVTQYIFGNGKHGSLATISSGQFSGNAATASALTNLTSNDKASSSATQRYVWFSYDNNTTGRPAYSSSFTYQSSTGTLTATKVKNAVWNDYAECRLSNEEEPGRCVRETASSLGMVRATQRLMPGCKFVSDTYGALMGETKEAKTPIAVSGRVLAYPYRNRNDYPLGAAVCSAPNGTVDIMTREEIMTYPERIVGTVSEIPNYEVWHGGDKECPSDIPVNGRIWIYVR